MNRLIAYTGLLLIMFFSDKFYAQSSADTLKGRFIQQRLNALSEAGKHTELLNFTDSVLVNCSSTFELFPRFKTLVYSTAAGAAYYSERYALSVYYDSLTYTSTLQFTPIDTSTVSNILLNLIVSEIKLARYDKALYYTNEAIKLAESNIPDNVQLGRLYHKYGTIKYHQGEYDSCLYYYRIVDGLFNPKDKEIAYDRTMLYQGFSSCYRVMEKYNLSLYYDSLAFTIYADDEISEPSRLADAYNRYGISLEELGRLTEAKEHYFKAIELIQNDSFQNFLLSSLFQNLAYVYEKKSDFGNALLYFQKAEDIRSSTLGADHPETLKTKIMLGVSLAALGKHDEAADIYESILSRLTLTYNTDHKSFGDIHYHLAQLYHQTDQAELYQLHIQKALEVYSENYGFESAFLIPVYRLLGKYEFDNTRIQKALAYQSKALDIAMASLDSGNKRITELHVDVAKSYLALEDYEASLAHVESAFANLGYSYGETDLKSIAFQSALLEALELLGHLNWKRFEREQNQSYLDACVEASETALELFENMRRNISDYDSQIELRERVQNIYDLLMTAYYESYKIKSNAHLLNSIHQLIESGKNFDFLVDFSTQLKAGNNLIPDGLKNYEDNLLEYIDYLKLLMLKQVSDRDSLSSRLIEKQNEFDRYLSKLEKEYPQYHKWRFENQIVNLEELQECLDDDAIVFNYYWGGTHVYLFVVSASKSELIRLSDSESVRDGIQSILESVKDSRPGRAIKQTDYDSLLTVLKEGSNLLYDLVVKAGIENKGGFEKIHIIPDGPLSYLPFELLTDDNSLSPGELKDWPYLMKTYTILYNYSCNYICSGLKAKSYMKRVLAFAPEYGNSGPSTQDRHTFSKLDFNQAEVEHIAQVCPADIYLGEKATKNRFLQSSQDYAFVHLAAHGISDNTEGQLSYVVFSMESDTIDNKLYAGELYGMQLNCHTVVLSACETALGELKGNDGLLGIGRAFRHARVSNTISSLWNVNDKSSLALFKNFYGGLARGESGAMALRNAKLNYLEQTDNAYLAHPFYWSGLVYYGQNTEINFTAPLWPKALYLLAFLIVLILGLKLFFKKN